MPDLTLTQINPAPPAEWFEHPDSPEGGKGLRFGCTQCGNCCSGPPGFVLVNDAEAAALANHFGLTVDDFIAKYTHMLPEGRSLTEHPGPRGLDCVFLDRTTVPGKAICGVYHHRPSQCRTWPYWTSIIKTAQSWDRARAICPGINKGELTTADEIKRQRAIVEM